MSKAESALGNDTWYQVLFTSTPLPMLIYDPATLGFIDVNTSAIAHYGYLPAEWARMTVNDLNLRPGPASAVEQLDALPAIPTSCSAPSHHLKKDGTVIDVRLTRHVIPYGETTATLLIVHDVSTQCQLEVSLRNAKQELDRAQHIARLGSWTRDFATENDHWSDQTYRNFGLPPRSSAASYPAFLGAVHPGDRARVDAAVSLALATRQPFAFQHRVVWPDGSVHVLQEQGIVVYDHSDKPLQMVGTTLDITERQRTEAALRQTQRDFQSAQRVAHIGTWALDLASGRFDAWSEETFRVFGYPVADLPTYDALVEDRVHRDDRERVRQARQQGLATPITPFDIEFRILNPQLGERTVHCVANVLADDDGATARMAGFVQDVTEARRAEEQIRYFAFYDKPLSCPTAPALNVSSMMLSPRLTACAASSAC